MPQSRKELFSLLAPLAAYLLLILLVQPWGNYPLNDDWIYARVLKHFLATGRFVFDHDSGAAFIGQGVLAAPVVGILGFSHTVLRCLTMAFGAGVLCLLWLLLRAVEVRPGIRAAALLMVVFNPLFGWLSLSFMTEIYGYFFALLGALVWVRDRNAYAEEALVSWPGAIATGLLIGAAFWIRQYCVLAFPALIGATFLTVWREGSWRRLRRSLPQLAGSCLAFGAVIAGYFLFARTMAQVPMTDYSHRLGRIWSVNPLTALVQSGIFLTYMTAFFLPLLALMVRRWTRRMAPAAIFLCALGAASALVFLQVPPSPDLHPQFPFLSNIIRNAGVGPVLFFDVTLGFRSPAWPPAVWTAIECLLLAANGAWATVIFGVPGILRKGGLRAELLLFALLFSLAALTATTVVDRMAVFDRYYLPETFGLALALALILSNAAGVSRARFLAVLLPLAFFTIAGLHDYFRWSDAGWDLYREALRSGISPANIQGSHEMNGWHAFDLYQSKVTPPGCIGPCHCDSDWYCLDDSYRVGMNVYGNYEVVDQRQPRYWLAPGPPVILSRRRKSQ